MRLTVAYKAGGASRPAILAGVQGCVGQAAAAPYDRLQTTLQGERSMTAETLHHDALIETARLELDRAHRAVLAVQAGEIRRGLELAMAALREASGDGITSGATPGQDVLTSVSATLIKAQTDLDAGRLAELGALIEAARRELNL